MKRLISLTRRTFTMNRINTGTFSIQDLCVWHVVLVEYGERLAPVALTREDGVAQTVVHLHESLRGSGGAC